MHIKYMELNVDTQYNAKPKKKYKILLSIDDVWFFFYFLHVCVCETSIWN